jgi:hypothetical protein
MAFDGFLDQRPFQVLITTPSFFYTAGSYGNQGTASPWQTLQACKNEAKAWSCRELLAKFNTVKPFLHREWVFLIGSRASLPAGALVLAFSLAI